MLTHMLFAADEPLGEVTPDALNDYDPASLVALPTDYWSGGLYSWVVRSATPDLPALRARHWALVKARRDEAEWSGCATALGRVDTDPDSQRKVGGAVQLALIAAGAGQPFALDWTMQDNSAVAHDGSAMIGLGVAVGQHVAACHEAALAKRAAIDAATDRAGIEAVPIEGGWPS